MAIERLFGLVKDGMTECANRSVPVSRIRFRASKKNAPDLDRMLVRFGRLRWQAPDDLSPTGDGAATEAPAPSDAAGKL